MSEIRVNNLVSLDGTSAIDIREVQADIKSVYTSSVGVSEVGTLNLSKYKYALFPFFHTQGEGGSCFYRVVTLTAYRQEIEDLSWTPDGSVNHADSSGNVLILNHPGFVYAEQIGCREGEDCSTAFNRAAEIIGHIKGRKGIRYTFTSQVSLYNNFIFEGNKCEISFGDGHLNLFNLLADVDHISISGVSRTIVNGTAEGDFCYKNFYSNYVDDGSTVVGFPVSQFFVAQRTEIKDCAVASSRIFSNGSLEDKTVLIVDGCDMRSDTHRVRPTSIYSYAHFKPVVSNNDLRSNYNEDVIKITGSGTNLKMYGNTIEHTGNSYLAEVDIFNGLEGAEIYSNTFYNVQVHRKQSGIEFGGDIGNDSIHDNKFYVTGLENSSTQIYPVYWRGSTGSIHNNMFRFSLSLATSSSQVQAVYLDREPSPVPPSDQVEPSIVSINGNIVYLEGSGGLNKYGFRTDTSGASDESITLAHNKVYGGSKFIEGNCYSLIGNIHRKAESPSGNLNCVVSSGNDFPTECNLLGVPSTSTSSFGIASGGVLNANNRRDFRVVTADGPITAITGGFPGDEVAVYVRTSTEFTHSNDLRLKGDASVTAPTRSWIHFKKTPALDGMWQESHRSF